jgi:hypothetical protein
MTPDLQIEEQDDFRERTARGTIWEAQDYARVEEGTESSRVNTSGLNLFLLPLLQLRISRSPGS